MLSITFLGLNSWAFESSDQLILVDPVFRCSFGHGPPGLQFVSLPQRSFHIEALRRAKAIFITHEHEDHFDIYTLNHFPRSTPIYMSFLSSGAAKSILLEMGFKVFPIEHKKTIALENFNFIGFQANHLSAPLSDEWDTLSFVVHNSNGAFFSNVDVVPTRKTIDFAKTLAPRFMISWGGKVYYGNLEIPLNWRNPKSKSTGNLAIDRSFNNPLGMQFSMKLNKVFHLEKNLKFLELRAQTRSSMKKAIKTSRRFQPACGTTEISNQELKELRQHLQSFAESLYGGIYFRRKMSEPGTLDGRSMTFAFHLKYGKAAQSRTFYYSSQDCDFIELKCKDPRKQFTRGLTLWASDLIRIFNGEFEVRILKVNFKFDYWDYFLNPMTDYYINTEIFWPYFHPLNRTASALRRYRRFLKNPSIT